MKYNFVRIADLDNYEKNAIVGKMGKDSLDCLDKGIDSYDAC